MRWCFWAGGNGHRNGQNTEKNRPRLATRMVFGCLIDPATSCSAKIVNVTYYGDSIPDAGCESDYYDMYLYRIQRCYIYMGFHKYVGGKAGLRSRRSHVKSVTSLKSTSEKQVIFVAGWNICES